MKAKTLFYLKRFSFKKHRNSSNNTYPTNVFLLDLYVSINEINEVLTILLMKYDIHRYMKFLDDNDDVEFMKNN